MPTFFMLTESGSRVATSYTPIRVTVDGAEHTLALHRLPHCYRVSDPRSGQCVIRNVMGGTRGLRVSVKPASLDDVKKLAAEQVQALANRLGAGVFNLTLRTAAPEPVTT